MQIKFWNRFINSHSASEPFSKLVKLRLNKTQLYCVPIKATTSPGSLRFERFFIQHRFLPIQFFFSLIIFKICDNGFFCGIQCVIKSIYHPSQKTLRFSLYCPLHFRSKRMRPTFSSRTYLRQAIHAAINVRMCIKNFSL